jgi:hypothetical protein
MNLPLGPAAAEAAALVPVSAWLTSIPAIADLGIPNKRQYEYRALAAKMVEKLF